MKAFNYNGTELAIFSPNNACVIRKDQPGVYEMLDFENTKAYGFYLEGYRRFAQPVKLPQKSRDRIRQDLMRVQLDNPLVPVFLRDTQI